MSQLIYKAPDNPLNNPLGIFSTVEGVDNEVKLEQPEKAEPPIEITPSGIINEVKLEQPEKAPWPMEVAPSGITKEVKSEQPKTA